MEQIAKIKNNTRAKIYQANKNKNVVFALIRDKIYFMAKISFIYK
jgi:hypothetical protein